MKDLWAKILIPLLVLGIGAGATAVVKTGANGAKIEALEKEGQERAKYQDKRMDEIYDEVREQRKDIKQLIQMMSDRRG